MIHIRELSFTRIGKRSRCSTSGCLLPLLTTMTTQHTGVFAFSAPETLDAVGSPFLRRVRFIRSITLGLGVSSLVFSVSRGLCVDVSMLGLVLSLLQQTLASVIYAVFGKYIQQVHSPLLTPRQMKNIVILGGSYAGVSTAHRLLKQHAGRGPFKITLVSPNTHFYWNMAAPRGLLPGQFKDEQL